jgi:hypothetical protein
MRWFNIALCGLVTLAAALFAPAAFTAVSLLATIGLIWLILPRRYEVWQGRLRLVFPVWSWSIPFKTIHMVREGQWYEAYGFIGIRFATAPSQAVTILRRNAGLFRRPKPRDLAGGPQGVPGPGTAGAGGCWPWVQLRLTRRKRYN